MRKVIKVLICATIVLVWGFVVIHVTAPEMLLQMRRSFSDIIQRDDDLVTIMDENVPLAGQSLESAADRNGWLCVKGSALLNETGEPVQLRGMSSHGIAWYPQYTSRDAIETTKLYGANLFRVSMYVDDDPGNYTTDSNDQQKNREAMFAALDNVIDLGMYAIADWHILKDGNPLNRLDCAVEFFDVLSQRYADKPNILYEICNEPNGDTTWDDIIAYVDQIIPVIRKNAPGAVIIVGTPDFCADIQPAMENPLPYENVMYSYHYYSGLQKDDYREILDAALHADFPVFVSEWGFGYPDDPLLREEKYGKAFLAYMQTHGISWANWSLSDKEENFSALLPGTDKTDGWTSNDLTISGQIVFDAFSP